MRGTIMTYEVSIKWDPEARVWLAICDNPCLALEAESYDELVERVQTALPDLLEETGGPACSSIRFRTDDFQRAYA